jgi:transcriptional regulator with XRE-family HTH domain
MCTIYSIATIPQQLKFNYLDSLSIVYPYLETDSIGTRLKKARERRQLSIKDILNYLGIKHDTYVQYEKNTRCPPRDILIKLNVFFENEICFTSYTKFIISDYISSLKSWRLKNKFTQKQAANYLNVNENSYLSWESGRSTPNKKSFEKIKLKINQ